ncbi:MFS general substrate transporter [Tricholoma matsutake]|nr:MFS general substrate transporter [Tricholoma matsutake 945]
MSATGSSSQVAFRAPRDDEPLAPAHGTTSEDEGTYLDGFPLALVVVGLMLCVFLASLDQLILTTAMPRIVSQFNSLAEISWIPNAYFLTMAGFMIVYGQLLNLVPLKWAIISSVIIFELGSLLCAVSFNMNFLLFGRGVAGVGGAGIVVCIFTAVAQVAPLKKRPALLGVVGASFGLSSVIGPLIGGGLTDHVSWRWCFYINLPIGGFALAVLFFFMPSYPAPPRPANRQGWKVLLAVDYIGIVLALGTSITFLYPLVEGGNAHPWNSGIVIGLFVTSGVLLGLFIAWSWYRGTEALLPLRLLRNRTVIGASLANFFLWMNMVIGVIYLTTWYQAVKGHSPTRSGIDLIPYSLVTAAFSAIAGVFVTKYGHYWHILVSVPLLASVAAGLEYTINETTTEAKLVGYQVLWGFSAGCTLQLPTVAIQSEYRDNIVDTRYAMSLATFIGFIGRIVALGVGSALFINELTINIPIYAPDAPYELVLHSVDAIQILPEYQKVGVIHAYVMSMRWTFIVGVPAGALAALASLLIRSRTLTRQVAASMDPEKETDPEKIPAGIIAG